MWLANVGLTIQKKPLYCVDNYSQPKIMGPKKFILEFKQKTI